MSYQQQIIGATFCHALYWFHAHHWLITFMWLSQ